MAEQTNLYISRRSQHADSLLKYKVLLNDEHVEDIGDGESIRITLDKGEYRLSLKSTWLTSNEQLFFARPSEDLYFECGNNNDGSIGSFFRTLTSPKSHLFLRKT